MYNKKLTPEQALLEIKLRMNYDLSKTLNENKFIVFEQFTQPEERLYNIVKMYNKVDGQGKINFPGDFHDGWDWSKYVSKYGVTQEEISAAKQKAATSSKTPATTTAQKSTTEKGVVIPIPSELKDVEGVKKLQDWLDKNHPGWHDKYKTLDRNKGRGYGKFGPRTKKWWDLLKDDFLVPDTKNSKEEEIPIETEIEVEKPTPNTPKVDTTPPTAQVPEPTKDFQKLAQTQFGANSQPSNVEATTKPSSRVANADTEF